ncbi:MAG: bifunctional DNA primase/polymerase [Acidimicrobiales bacterium]
MSDVNVVRPVDAALGYALRGWPVFPCHALDRGACTCGHNDCASPGKHPRVRGGLNAATADSGTIARWWRHWPDANIAVRTGAPSGLVVLDIDPRHGGARSLHHLVQRYGPLPAAPRVRTGSGGWHLFFEHPNIRVRNSAGLIGDGLDIRGDGGYVIAPPSRHASGDSYAWERFTMELPSLPDWMHALVAEPEHVVAPPPREWPARTDRTIETWARVALDRESRRVSAATRGTRNATLNRAAFSLGQIVGAGLLDGATVEESLVGCAVAIGLSEREARLTTQSGVRAGARQPRQPLHVVRPAPSPSPSVDDDGGWDVPDLT